MRRRILLFTAIAMMALMMGAGIVPAVAKPGGGAEQLAPHQCFDVEGFTGCNHAVLTPSDRLNTQSQTRNTVGLPKGDQGAVVDQTTVDASDPSSPQQVIHRTHTPSGNDRLIGHVNPRDPGQ